ALPVGPAAIVAGRPEHIVAEDEGAEAVHRGAGEAIVGPALFADHRSKGASREEPTHQLTAALAERMLQALVRPGPEAVDGDSKNRYAHLTHRALRLIANLNQLRITSDPARRSVAPRWRRGLAPPYRLTSGAVARRVSQRGTGRFFSRRNAGLNSFEA